MSSNKSLKVSIEIKCPVCNKEGMVEIPKEILGKKKFGTLKIQIPTGTICEDLFILFLTTKGKVMGYEKIDPQLISLLQKLEKSVLISLIEKYSLYGMFSLFHAKLFNYPIYILGKEDLKLKQLFNQIYPSEFQSIPKINFMSIDSSEVKSNKKRKKALVLNTIEGGFYTPWFEKLNLENKIFRDTLEQEKEKEQFQIMKNEIDYFLDEVFYTVSILHDSKVLYVTDLLDILAKKSSLPKINRFRVSLIKLFISRRIDNKLSQKIINKIENLVFFR